MNATLLNDTLRKQRESFTAECCLLGIVSAFTTDDSGHMLVIVSKGATTRDFHSIQEAQAGLTDFAKEVTHV